MSNGDLPVIYVLEDSTGWKIGKSAEAAKRFKDLRTANSGLRLKAAVHDPNMDVTEKRLHKWFGKDHNEGEWFNHGATVDAWVERFHDSPYTAKRFEDLPTSFAYRVWPWEDPLIPLVDENDQLCLPISAQYIAPIGWGNGQTSHISEDWYTPAEYVDAVRDVFGGTIDLDPMSCVEANRTIRATRFYTAEVDGLKFIWDGNVFLNPPWGTGPEGAKERAVRKALSEYANGNTKAIVLVLNANAITTAWFAPLLARCDAMAIPNHRVSHRGPGGKGGAPNTGTVFVYLGPDAERFAERFARFGSVVRPMASGGMELAEDWEESEP